MQCLIKYQALEQILFGWMIVHKSRNFQNYLNLSESGVIVILLTDGKPKVAQKGHACKLKMLLQTINFTCKLKIGHAN